ncbi:glycosyltransferase family 2 protein [Dyadobacter psychrotolerans]|uniref:Glycosyltransferase family 2 protein n=1 Tax=Dyadobacter psychrotolerans TaxID=2541721 RepID=A0A4R5E0X7_9BACT|nr:glycosyltransferase family 2 protein [Dyadobacter psychrotolerans]TDE18610.1 glycosyltransferase family 2 protein [Dyadobacter psychrotolerans]
MIKASFCIITYNHEKFVGKMLDSLLMQETTFPFEIIVGDDCSKDRTAEILKEYQSRYPDKIRLLLHPKNLGLNGKYNALQCFAIARGEYIAQFDGDDYLTSPHKLQKQVEMLDANPHYSASFHNAQAIYDDNSAPPHLVNWLTKKEYTVDDLIGEDELCFIATSSLVFRKKDLADNPDPDWTNLSTSGDIPRNIMFASRGPIGYIDEVMSVYRKNRGGASFADNHYSSDFLFNRIQLYSNINKHFNYKYDAKLRKNIATYYYKLLFAKQYKDSYFSKLKFALKYLDLAEPTGEKRKEIIRQFVVPPFLMKTYSFFALSLYNLRAKA